MFTVIVNVLLSLVSTYIGYFVIGYFNPELLGDSLVVATLFIGSMFTMFSITIIGLERRLKLMEFYIR